MSFVESLSSSKNVAETLYHIVCPMLASRDCIKCVSDNGDNIFTLDVLCLLSHLDIEHPVGELILQALEAHKKKHSTGSKTLLYLTTHLSKVVSQLRSLGIPNTKSLTIIQACVSSLIQDVVAISMPVTTSTEEPMCDNLACQNADAIISSTDCVEEQLSKTHSTDFQNFDHDDNPFGSKMPSLSKDSLLDTSDGEEAELKPVTDEHQPHFSETDPVVLKMTSCEVSVPEEDISWYFANSNNEPTIETMHQLNKNFTNSILLTSENTLPKMYPKSIPITVSNQNPTDHSSTIASKSCNAVKGKSTKDITSADFSTDQHCRSVSSLQAKEEHDSDFEDCFDDDSNRKHVSITVESTPPYPFHYSDGKVQDFLMLHNARKHFSDDADFECGTTLPPFAQKGFGKNNHDLDGVESEEEFAACFEDIDCKNRDANNFCIEEKKATYIVEPIEGPCHKGKEKSSSSTTDLNVTISNVESVTVNDLPTFSNAPVKARGNRPAILKVNEMLESLLKRKSSSSRFQGKYSRNEFTKECMPPQAHAGRVDESMICTPSANETKVIENFKARDHTEILHLHDLLPHNLTEKQHTSKVIRSHQIAISSRHLSEEEGNQSSAKAHNVEWESPPPAEACVTKDLHTLESSDNLNDFKDTIKTAEEAPNVSLNGCSDSNAAHVYIQSQSTLNVPLSQSQRLQLPQDTKLLVDTELSNIVEQLFRHQMQDKDFTGFNLKLVDCLWASIPTPNLKGEHDDDKFAVILPGIIMPCDSHILHKLSPPNYSAVRKALLVKADVTPSQHHRGYKSTLTNKVIISHASDTTDCSESSWAASIITNVKELGVNMLLVKGIVKDSLVDELESVGVLVLTNLSYHTLNTLAYVTNIDMVTYITDACEDHVCNIELRPLCESWMDHLDESQRHFLEIVNTCVVQTVVLSHSNPVSACLAEEKLWKSLNRLSNAIKDGKVLPGMGRTEAWCAEVLCNKALSALDANEGMQHAVLELVSQVFRNYSTLVQENLKPQQDCGDLFYQTTDRLSSDPSSSQNPNEAAFVFESESAIDHTSPKKIMQGILKYGSINTYELGDKKEEKGVPTSQQHMPMDFKSIACVFDNFSSKLASWETAVETVTLLSSLDSLVITGIDMASSDREFAVL